MADIEKIEPKSESGTEILGTPNQLEIRNCQLGIKNLVTKKIKH